MEKGGRETEIGIRGGEGRERQNQLYLIIFYLQFP